MRRLLLGLLLLVPWQAWAADVTMAVRTDAESIDPHFHAYTPNSAVARHIFDGLTQIDARGRVQARLAMSWQVIGDDAWEFKLRPGVLFHNGGALTVADVVFTLKRAPNVPMLSGWVGTGEASSPFTALMATYDPKTGLGPSNRGRWSNAAFDQVLGEALRTMDETKRNGLYAKAAEIAVGEMGVIPVYFTVNTWASRKGLTYDARADEISLAMGLKPAILEGTR